MPIIQNRKRRFTILYLEGRSLRFNPKQKKKVTQKELESDKFKKRADDFRIVSNTKSQPPAKVVAELKEEN